MARRQSIPRRVALAALLVALACGAAVGESRAHQFCRMTDGGDPPAFKACVTRQIEGARAIARRLGAVRERAAYGARVIESYDECRALWSPDYDLIHGCLEARLEGG